MAALSPLLAPFQVDVVPFHLPLQRLPDPVHVQQAAHHPGHSQCRLVSDFDLLGNRGHWPPLVQFPHQVDPAREVDFAVLQLRTGQVVEPPPTVPAAVTAQITPVAAALALYVGRATVHTPHPIRPPLGTPRLRAIGFVG
jgi:hypothetical protein